MGSDTGGERAAIIYTAPESARLEKLRLFLDRLAALRAPDRMTPAYRLISFLELAAPYFSETLPAPTRLPLQPLVDTTRLQEIVHCLERPLRSARTAGAFLNVWLVAGIGRSELRNSAVLAWFLDPLASHGLGSAVLRDFLCLAAHRGGWPLFDSNLLRTAVRTEEWPLGSATDRVDIAIDGANFVVFVEVKIDADEGPDQLLRYLERAREKAYTLRRPHARVVYLSPRSPTTIHPDLATVTWQDVSRLLARRKREGIAGVLANQFAQHIRTLS